MDTKDFAVTVKAAGDDEGLKAGQVSAVISVFGNEDSVGDVVMPGAFKEDLERWEAKGDPIPFVWSHDWADPFSHVGRILKAEETEAGLQVLAQIDDMDSNPKAAQVYRLLKGRRVTQFSFAYDVEDAGWGKRGDREVYELRKLRIHEGGPTLIGANRETELLAVKAQRLAANAKAGITLTQDGVDSLTAARMALDEALAAAAVEPPTTSEPSGPEMTDEPSQVDEPATDDEQPDGAKSDEPHKSIPRRALAVARITQLS